MKNKTLKIIFAIFISGVFIFNIIKDHDGAVKKGLAFKLDQLNVGDLYLYLFNFGLSSSPDQVNNGKMNRLAKFYSVLAVYLPDHSEASGLSGFTYFHIGKSEKAYKAYKRAAEIDPEFFWYHHNQAALLAKAGQTQKAVLACREAIDTDPKYVMSKIMGSKEIYFPLVLAKISEHIRSCHGEQCQSPNQYMVEIFSQFRDQISQGYKYCQQVLYAREQPQEILRISKSWPLAGF